MFLPLRQPRVLCRRNTTSYIWVHGGRVYNIDHTHLAIDLTHVDWGMASLTVTSASEEEEGDELPCDYERQGLEQNQEMLKHLGK